MAYTTVNKQTDHFRVKTYTGNGAYGNNITFDESGNMQPDIVWIKQRGCTSGHHLYDSVRGPDKRIRPDSNAVESTGVNLLHSYDTNGFTVDDDSGINSNGGSFVAWNWLAGGSAPTKTYKVVVVSDSGNKYRFRDSADTTTFGSSAVTLDLQEGGTYTFDVSDSTLNSHPFVIGTAANSSEYSTGVTYKLDGVTKTYSQYTSGFSAATSRQLIITVPASAPALYYWCSQHSGMGGAINTNATFGSSNFDGNLQSLVSANTTAGISVVRYTGNGSASATLGHGLGGVLNQIWQKDMTATDSWHCNTNAPSSDLGLSSGYGLYFNNNNAAQNPSDGSMDNFTATTFGFNANGGNVNAVNENAIPCMAYCFTSVPGFSSFGNYVGNGDSDGAFINTGFKPAFVMIKNTDLSAESWVIHDNKRRTYNANNTFLYPNLENAEVVNDSYPIDFLSNGFKCKNNNDQWNGDGHPYIYMAWGQTCVGSNNVPATAK
jgi:hypothetical protein